MSQDNNQSELSIWSRESSPAPGALLPATAGWSWGEEVVMMMLRCYDIYYGTMADIS